MKRWWSIVALATAMLSADVASAWAPPTETELKERFSKRVAPLTRLKDGGKVGETTQGLVEAREKGDASVGKLVAEENEDRRKLYELIGERTDEPASVVAEQAAIRNFRKARPNHWLKLRSGEWVQKKDLPDAK